MRDLHLQPQDQPLQTEAGVMAKSEDLIEQFLRARHKLEEDEFLHSECERDLARGTAGPLMSKDEMDARWGRGKWLPLPRFQIVQASGKKRPIDDGARNAHNESLSNTDPARHAAASPGVRAGSFQRGAHERTASGDGHRGHSPTALCR